MEAATNRSAEFEPSTGLDGVEKFCPHGLSVLEGRQLEQVHAGAGGRQTVNLGACAVNTECWEQVLKNGQ